MAGNLDSRDSRGYRRIGRGSSTSHSGGAPHPLCSAGKHSTKVNWAFGPASFASPASLALPRSFSIVNPRGRQLKARLYSSKLSYSYCMDHHLTSRASPAKVLPYWEFCRVLRGGGPPPLKTVQKIGHPGTADFLYSFEGEGGGPSKLYKTPSKGGPWLVKIKLLKLCRTTI